MRGHARNIRLLQLAHPVWRGRYAGVLAWAADGIVVEANNCGSCGGAKALAAGPTVGNASYRVAFNTGFAK